jgi:hypothetical protein
MATKKKKVEETEWRKGLENLPYVSPLAAEKDELETHRQIGWNNFVVIRDMERFVDAVENIADGLHRIAEALENQKN